MIEEIDRYAGALEQDYRLFVESVKGVVTSFFFSTNYRYPANRYATELRVRRAAESTASRIDSLVRDSSRQIARISLQRASARADELGAPQASKEALERAESVIQITADDVSALLTGQLDRDGRSALQYVIRGSIDKSQVFNDRLGFSAIDRAGRAWDSTRMVRVVFRHHLVLLANDLYVDRLASVGVRKFTLDGNGESAVFDLAEYPDVRVKNLHPNTILSVE